MKYGNKCHYHYYVIIFMFFMKYVHNKQELLAFPKTSARHSMLL